MSDMIDADPRIRGAVVRGISAGWPMNSPPPVEAGFVENLERLLLRLEPAGRGDLIKLARNWGISQFDRHIALETARREITACIEAPRVRAQRIRTQRKSPAATAGLFVLDRRLGD
jgi:hypothetical protein